MNVKAAFVEAARLMQASFFSQAEWVLQKAQADAADIAEKSKAEHDALTVEAQKISDEATAAKTDAHAALAGMTKQNVFLAIK